MLTPRQIKAVLDQRGLRPNRALGQNFLIDEAARNSILPCAGIAGKAVLEIGPGLGALTQGLCERAASVLAVELDRGMADYLEETLLPCFKNLTILHGDILKTDFGGYLSGPFHAVGNLPYYITTPIIERLMAALPESMTLMVQREVAQRLFALPQGRQYGPLAVFLALFYTGRVVLELSPQSYYPAPDVHSSVVRLEKRADGPAVCSAALLRFLNQCFMMRRKTLLNNLKAAGFDLQKMQNLFQKLEINPQIRPENLPSKLFLELYHAI